MSNRVFSADDADLNSAAIITSRKRVYSDINALFSPIPGNGDIYKATDANAVKQSVKNIILTRFMEKPFRPNFGTSLDDTLFENNNALTRHELRSSIERAIAQNEPRARITQISINSKYDNQLEITVSFIIVSLEIEVTVTVSLERLR